MKKTSAIAHIIAGCVVGFMAASTLAQAAESIEKQCAAIGSRLYEQTADSPAVVTKASYVTDGKPALEFQFMFGKRSVVQGMPVGENVHEIPPHCRVEGYFAPAVKFLLLLPDPKKWNTRVLYGACDAFCGAIDEDMPIAGLLNGYATIATDGGHINKRPFDGTWGYNNREGEIDFGYRASHLAAQLSKVIAAQYYGKKHSYAYITGFSKGGLAGIKSALMYPKDFDGVLSRAPVVRYQEINAVRMPWIVKSNQGTDGKPLLLAADTKLIHSAVIKQCDAIDGAVDGIINDPRQCDFKPSSLLCKRGKKTNCLTKAQVGAVEKFYSQPKNNKGEVVYPYALEYGSEQDWAGFLAPFDAQSSSYAETISRTFLRYMAFDKDPGPTFDWMAFDPLAQAKKLQDMKPVWDATDPDLRAFRDAGGKMMVIHGWGDGAVSARMTVDWYKGVKKFMGDSTDSFVKLYVVPGNKHGGSPGDGPNVNDSFATLVDWVEKDKVPNKMVFRMEDKNGKVTRTRAHYPYPATTKYNGSGNLDDEASFYRVD